MMTGDENKYQEIYKHLIDKEQGKGKHDPKSVLKMLLNNFEDLWWYPILSYIIIYYLILSYITKIQKKHISQKYGQIIPTPHGSLLHHTKPSQLPYNAKNQFFRDIGHI